MLVAEDCVFDFFGSAVVSCHLDDPSGVCFCVNLL